MQTQLPDTYFIKENSYKRADDFTKIYTNFAKIYTNFAKIYTNFAKIYTNFALMKQIDD